MRKVAGVSIPDSTLARDALKRIQLDEPVLLLLHALRAFVFGALTGYREGRTVNLDMLYVGTLFHNIGLSVLNGKSAHRFEIDSANEARKFLRCYQVDEATVADVWNAIALHTTPGIPEHMSSLVALVNAGVQMDLTGARFDEFTAQQRDEVVRAYPRGHDFKLRIIEALARGMEQRPETTFGTINADVLDRCDPGYRRLNFCGLVLGSKWQD